MARLINVDITCDWPFGCDVRVPEGDDRVVAKTVSIDGKQAREFLICKKHLDDFEELVLGLMQAGVPVTGKNGGRAKKTATVPTDTVDPEHPDAITCKADVDGEPCGRPIRKRTGMAQHVIRSHGFESLEAYEAVYGPAT